MLVISYYLTRIIYIFGYQFTLFFFSLLCFILVRYLKSNFARYLYLLQIVKIYSVYEHLEPFCVFIG
jgi:hypothetical protein